MKGQEERGERCVYRRQIKGRRVRRREREKDEREKERWKVGSVKEIEVN